MKKIQNYFYQPAQLIHYAGALVLMLAVAGLTMRASISFRRSWMRRGKDNAFHQVSVGHPVELRRMSNSSPLDIQWHTTQHNIR